MNNEMKNKLWITGTNVPGYLPDSDEYQEPMSFADCRHMVIAEMQLDQLAFALHGEREPLEALEHAMQEVRNAPADTEFSLTVAGRCYWIMKGN